ncbi:MAG: DNA primase [Deltaproteobacteria bacterium]|nr:DNA primase [Deltaproteobacteria bacterium]
MEPGRIPEEALQSIRARVSILDVVGAHVALKRAGRNWTGLCPFHSEKTPSFVVNEERGTYHCFGCGAGGNVFRFLMEAEGRSFREAAEILAGRAGVSLELKPELPEMKKAREERDVLLELLELAARYYRHQLVAGRAGEAARRYLSERGIGPEASDAFRLGCAPSGWDALCRYLRKKGLDLALAARAGLAAERSSGGYYDRLRNRLVFPIWDSSGRVVSFGGRSIGSSPNEPKYLNGPESAVFHKSETLYGLTQAQEALRRERMAVLVEGYIDVVSLHAHGHRSALATLGTALTREHALALKRRVEEVVLVYDGDEAGRKAAFRSLEVFLSAGLACRAVLLPPEHDPDSFVRAGGDLAALIREAGSLFEVCLQEIGRKFDLGSVEGRLAAVEATLPGLRAVTEPMARALYARRAAEALGVPEQELLGRMARESGHAAAAPAQEETPPFDAVERSLLECLVFEPGRRKEFTQRGLDAWMKPGALREACRFVSGREEEAHCLPLENAPSGTGSLLSELLVGGGERRRSFDSLEAKLRLRNLEARARILPREIREAEARGDAFAVRSLQQEKMDLDRALVECRRKSAS